MPVGRRQKRRSSRHQSAQQAAVRILFLGLSSRVWLRNGAKTFSFERVSCAQKLGFNNREIFHNTDWSDAAANTKVMKKMVGDWITYHDPEVYAYENYHKCAENLAQGTPFDNTNIPPGYTYRPWTVRELLGASDRGEVLKDEGDWS
jgi:hypothetical protein